MKASFPAMRTGLAERREKKPLVAVVDNFRDSETTTSHGEITESVMLTHGRLKDEEIQRLHGESGAPFPPQVVVEAPAEQTLAAYSTFSIGATTSFFNMVSDNIDFVLQEQPTIRVINQSQSQTPGRLAEPFLGFLSDSEEFRSHMASGLGLEADAPAPKVISSLLDFTEVLLQEHPVAKQAKERYTLSAKRAYDKGVVNVIAAGNQGPLASSLQEAGVKAGPGAFRSVLVNDYVTVVGAATAEGQLSQITSPDSGYEVLALGEGVPFSVDGQTALANGTSVATPLIASQAADTVKRHPDWGVAQIENDMFGPVDR